MSVAGSLSGKLSGSLSGSLGGAGGFALDAAAVVSTYSVARRTRATYSGPLLRVRRSGDGAESDFGMDANGDLDTSALETWVVAGGGTQHGYVVTLYDQSGLGLDVGQSTALEQPQIVSSGSTLTAGNQSRPAMSLTGTEWLTRTDALGLSGDIDLDLCVVAERADAVAELRHPAGIGSNPDAAGTAVAFTFDSGGSTSSRMFNGFRAFYTYSTALNGTGLHVADLHFDSGDNYSAYQIDIDGEAGTELSVSGTGPIGLLDQAFSVGSSAGDNNGAARRFKGDISEVWVASGLTSGERAEIVAEEVAYYG